MENDSTNMDGAVGTANSTAVGTDSVALTAAPGDSLVHGEAGSENASDLPMPTAKDLGISITTGYGDGNPLAVAVGDTFDFPVTVSWSVNGSALLVVPSGSANAKGITQLGVSQESSRAVKDGKEIAQIAFNFKLVAQDTGNLNIPAMRFEIPTQMGNSIEMRSDSVPLRVDAPFNPLPILAGVAVAVCVAGFGLWRIFRKKRTAMAAAVKNARDRELREKMLVLKQRVSVADSREWLLELENLCKEQVPEKFTGASNGLANGTAASNGVASASGAAMGSANEASDDGWEALLKEFAHARYGGGKRDAFELREIWKTAMKLMGVEEES